MRRHEDWLKQADSDLCAAEDSASSTHYEWACFQAQQAAEKALKALIISKGGDIRTLFLQEYRKTFLHMMMQGGQ